MTDARERQERLETDQDEVSAIEEETDEQSVEQATRLSSRLIYEVIRRDGEEELKRPTSSLVWSGVAAGLLISFSLIAEAVFRSNIPEGGTRFLVENLGYAFGFVLVISGRMQLFTENTITTILPLVARFGRESVLQTARLWSTVLLANVVGAFIAAAFVAYSGAFGEEMLRAIHELAVHAMALEPGEAVARAVPAGVLVAALVWMMPTVPYNGFWVIVAFAWLIAAGDFAHIVVGSVEMAFLIVTGDLSVVDGLSGFFLPVLLGNVIGGTAIFAMLAWGQVRRELGRRGNKWRRFRGMAPF